MRRPLLVATIVILAMGAALAGAASAQNRLPKLPAAYALPQAADSPGKVTFSHESHVDPNGPQCTSCHPKLFRILKPGATTDGTPITHERMEKGAACGTCHGKTTFGFDDCTLCHK